MWVAVAVYPKVNLPLQGGEENQMSAFLVLETNTQCSALSQVSTCKEM